jgi:hypothetical protein
MFDCFGPHLPHAGFRAVNAAGMEIHGSWRNTGLARPRSFSLPFLCLIANKATEGSSSSS